MAGSDGCRYALQGGRQHEQPGAVSAASLRTMTSRLGCSREQLLMAPFKASDVILKIDHSSPPKTLTPHYGSEDQANLKNNTTEFHFCQYAFQDNLDTFAKYQYSG